MLESDARLIERIIKVKGRKYTQLIVYVPRSLATDSAFPFKPKDMVRIGISGEGLTIRRAELPYVGVDEEKDAKRLNRQNNIGLESNRTA